jgi:YcxB-like protein
MNIEYQCNLGDYQEAMLAHGNRSMERKILYAVGSCFISTFVVFLLVINGIREGAALLGVIVFWFCSALIIKLACPLWIERDFGKHPIFAQAQTVRIDENAIEYKSALAQSEAKWGAYSKFHETPNLFMLYLGARLFHVIPKRAFHGTQLDDFRELLREKVRPQ